MKKIIIKKKKHNHALIVQIDARQVQPVRREFGQDRGDGRALRTHQLSGQMHHNRDTLPDEYTESVLRARGDGRALQIPIPRVEHHGPGIVLLGELDHHPTPPSGQFDLPLRAGREARRGGDANEEEEETEARRARFLWEDGTRPRVVGQDEGDEEKSSRFHSARGAEESLPTACLPDRVHPCLRLHSPIHLSQSLSTVDRLLYAFPRLSLHAFL